MNKMYTFTKKGLALLLSTIMLLGVFPLSALADEIGEPSPATEQPAAVQTEQNTVAQAEQNNETAPAAKESDVAMSETEQEQSAPSEETNKSEEPVTTEETQAPEETATTEETQAPEEAATTEETQKPEETVTTEETQNIEAESSETPAAADPAETPAANAPAETTETAAAEPEADPLPPADAEIKVGQAAEYAFTTNKSAYTIRLTVLYPCKLRLTYSYAGAITISMRNEQDGSEKLFDGENVEDSAWKTLEASLVAADGTYFITVTAAKELQPEDVYPFSIQFDYDVEQPTAEPEQIEELTGEPEKTEELASEPEKVEEDATEPEQVEELAAEPEKVEENTTEPEQTEEPVSEPEKAEEPTTEPGKSEEPAAEPEKTEEPAAEPKKANAAMLGQSAPASEPDYTFPQAEVLLKDVLSACGYSIDNFINNTAVSVTPSDAVTLSETRLKNKNRNSLTLTASAYFETATLTVGSVVITLSWPEPSEIPGDEPIETPTPSEEPTETPTSAPTYTFPQAEVLLKDVLSACGYSIDNFINNTAVSVTPSDAVTLSETRLKNKNRNSLTLTASAYFETAALTVGSVEITIAWPEPTPAEPTYDAEYTFADEDDYIMLLSLLTEQDIYTKAIDDAVVSDGDASAIELHDYIGDYMVVPTASFDTVVLTLTAREGGVYTVALHFPEEELSDYTVEEPLRPEVPADAIWANDVLYLTGKMPGNAMVVVEPVEKDGIEGVLSYDIKIYANENQRAKGKAWQPAGDKVQVHFFHETFGNDEIAVFHWPDGATEAEYVGTVTAADGWVDFEAESFSAYSFLNLITDTLQSWKEKLYTLAIKGYTFLNPNYKDVETVTLEEGLELVKACTITYSNSVKQLLTSLLNRITNNLSMTFENLGLTSTERDSIVVYALEDGKLGKVLAENLESDAEIKLGDAEGFVVVRDTGYRHKSFAFDSLTLDGMMPKAATAAVENETEATEQTLSEQLTENDAVLAAYNISIKEGEAAYQPDEEHPISVEIADEGITADGSYAVLHIHDDGTVEEVQDFTVEDGKVSFAASGFSVYVIIDHEGENKVRTPRVAFHYIDPAFTDNGDGTYSASAYEFLNKNNEYQITQILKDGESLEQVINPANKKDDEGNEVSFFYGWYTVNMSEDSTAWNSEAASTPYYTGTIKYTWPNPLKVDDQMPITITPTIGLSVGDTVTWQIGNTAGTAELDAEGTAHVYIVPVYEDFYFVNFHMGNKEADEGLRNNLLLRRLVVFGQSDTALVRIGNVEGPSPDPSHQIFAGWETAALSGSAISSTIHYYQTLDDDGNEIKKTVGPADGYEESANETGYYITVEKAGHAMTSLDLYPVFAEARWLFYELGKSGNGASYVPAAYRLTNDEGNGTYFESLETSTRAGYRFEGWYANAAMSENEIMNRSGDYDLVISTTADNVTTTTTTHYNKAIQLTDANGQFVADVKGKVFYVDTNDGADTSKLYMAAAKPEGDNYQKLFEITAEGKLYFYKDLDSLKVSAKWGANTVNYTVVYWLQNANDDNYTLMYYKTLQGEAGQRTAAAEAQTSDTFVLNGITYHPYEEYKLQFAHIAADQDKENDGEQSGIQQQEIEGDGSTIVNVYYDRNVYRLRFDIGFARRTGTYGSTTIYTPMTADEAAAYSNTVYGVVDGNYVALTPDGNGGYTYAGTLPYSGILYRQETISGTWQYSVSNTTGPNYRADDNWDTFLTQKRYNLGTTNPFGPGEYTGTYEQTDSSGTLYRIFYYDIVGKYGENIMSRYPGSQSIKRNGNNSYSFVGWLAQRDSYYNARLNTSIKGYLETLTEDLILTGGSIPGFNSTISNVNPDNYKAITIDGDNTWTGEHGITQEFRCRYTRLSDAKKYLYRIYLADAATLEYPSEPTDKFVITGGGGSNPNLQTPPTYFGYTLKDKKVLSESGNEMEPASNNYSAYAIPELTEAGVGNGMIMVFRLRPNLHYVSYKYGSGSTAELNNTAFGDAVAYYYSQSLISANIYQEAAVAATPEGYSFKGWYTNPDGVGSRFNFDSTMPDGDIVLYAVYSPVRFRVEIDPNGAEIDHIDHTGASYVGSYNGIEYNFAPFNRAATDERSADAGYIRNQATYINGTYGTPITEYTVSRRYVPISDTSAAQYSGRLYYYVNMQYKNSDGTGLPSDLRSALYIDVTPSTPGGEPDETELRELYRFFREDTGTNFSLAPGSFTGMTAQNLSYDAWKALYVEKQEDSREPQLYRKCNSKETWVFLGWFKDSESMPYNFSDPVRSAFRLKAHWRLDGGYKIQYTPEYWLESADGNTYLINGDMDVWIDPDTGAETLSYTDGAETEIYKQPTNLTKNAQVVTDNSINFLGWRLVSVNTTTDSNGNPVVTYMPLELDDDNNPVYYDPGDDFVIDVQYADSNNIIHMQAVYEETGSSIRRPAIANLTLDANSGFLVDASGNALTKDSNVDWSGVGTVLLDESADQIVFGDIQSGAAVHLYRYATRDEDTTPSITGGTNYFVHPKGYFLLGFDPQSNPENIVWVDPQDDSVTGAAQPYVPNYPADSIIAVQRTDNKILYAIWEPMVYVTFVNKTAENGKAVGPVTFGLRPTNPEDAEALTVINVKDGMYTRVPLSNYSSITLKSTSDADYTEGDETITLAFPKGAEKNITVIGRNELGNGSILYWDSKLGENAHGNEASGNCDYGDIFTFVEKLVMDKTGIVVTFTSDQHDRTLVYDDNYPGGGTQEVYFSQEEFDDLTASSTTPNTNTRFGYTLKGWATTAERANAGTVDYGTGYSLEGQKLVDFFGDELIKTLYAVWEAEATANTIRVFKTVPEPGSQTEDFAFTLSLEGTFHNNNNNRDYVISTVDSNAFTLKSGQHARVYITEHVGTNNTRAYLQADINVYAVGVTAAGEADAAPIDTKQVKIEVGANGEGSFYSTERFSLTENSTANYTPSIELAASTPTEGTEKDITVSGAATAWSKPDAGGTVIYTNTLSTYDITIDKTAYVGGAAVTTQFAFTASYALGSDTVDLGTFYVNSGTPTIPEVLKKIPAGAVLTISEVDTADKYATIVKVDSENETQSKSTTLTVSGAHTVHFVNTLKSYNVKMVKVDQDGTAGVVAATFNLTNVTGNYTLGTDLQAYDIAGSDGVFYASGTDNGNGGTYEPLYAGQKYTLDESFTESGYIGISEPVTITVGGSEIEPFSFSDANVTAEKDGATWVIKVKNQEVKKITIIKAFHDPLVAQKTFTFEYSYNFGGEKKETFSLNVPNEGSMSKVIEVPVGATNLAIKEVLSESDAAVYDTTMQENGKTPVTASTCRIDTVNDAATVTFTNTRKEVNVTVKKTVSDTSDTTSFAFTATLTYSGPVKSFELNGTDNLITDEDGKVTFELKHGGSQKLTIPYGAKLVITETVPTDYKPSTTSNEYQDSDSAAESFTVDAVTTAGTIHFTNKKVADLTITKKVTGLFGDRTKKFTFTIAGDGLTEVSYGFTRYTSTDGTTWTEGDSGAYTVIDGKIMFLLQHNEKIVIKDLPLNVQLTVSETNKDEYTTTWTQNSTATTGNSVTVTLTADVELTVENNLPALAPTNVRTVIVPFAVMLGFGIAIAMIFWVGKRRREHV